VEPLFPTAPEEIEPWRRKTGLTADEARKRFMQYAILEAIASSAGLARLVAFKGGNALRFIYGNRRSTLDLDFTADAGLPDDPDPIRARLDAALRPLLARFRVKARCQRVRRNPPGRDKIWPTYDIAVGYQLPGDRLYQNFDEFQDVATTIDVEISINEVICEAVPRRLHPAGGELCVCTLEDILAEKLRALLQQPIRKRSRPQDVFDIASATRRFGDELDLGKISRYLVRKAEARDIHPRKDSFDDTVRSHAATGYDVLIGRNAPDFIPFETAWVEVLELVAKLEIP
jgi:predicted nucleotidyltransferase component of viral defense system